MELINERKSSDEKDEKGDLLSNLVNANEELMGGGEQRLREEELIGTSFLAPLGGSFMLKVTVQETLSCSTSLGTM